MAIKFLEGFDHYTDWATQYHGKWNTYNGAVQLGPGRCDGNSLGVTNYIQYSLKDPLTAYVVVGFAAYFTDFGYPGGAPRPILTFQSVADSLNGLFVNSVGQLFFQDTVNGTSAPYAPTGDSIVTNRWHYIEFQWNIANINARVDAGNWVKIYIDGVQQGYATGVPSGDINWHGSRYAIADMKMHGAGTNMSVWYDDLYFMDDTAPGKTTPLGDRRVVTFFPDADDTVQFVPLSGPDNFAMIDEAGPDEDTTYNSSETPGDRDIFTHPYIGTVAEWIPCKGLVGGDVGTTEIDALQLSARVKKTDIGTRLISPFIISAAAETTHVQQAIPNDYRYRYEVFELDPNGNIPWTPAAMNAAKVGYQGD